MRIWTQKSASIQKRTSPLKFDNFAEKSEKDTVSYLSTKVALGDQEPRAMYTMRNLIEDADAGRWIATKESGVGVPWASEWRPDPEATGLPAHVRHVIFGHDAKRGLQQHDHATGLD